MAVEISSTVTRVTSLVTQAISLMDSLPLHVKQMRNSTHISPVVYVCTRLSFPVRKEGNALFNDALKTLYLRLYGIGSGKNSFKICLYVFGNNVQKPYAC